MTSEIIDRVSSKLQMCFKDECTVYLSFIWPQISKGRQENKADRSCSMMNIIQDMVLKFEAAFLKLVVYAAPILENALVR